DGMNVAWQPRLGCAAAGRGAGCGGWDEDVEGAKVPQAQAAATGSRTAAARRQTRNQARRRGPPRPAERPVGGDMQVVPDGGRAGRGAPPGTTPIGESLRIMARFCGLISTIGRYTS